jgi:ribulose-5-phosphate 4-epimerase/fuculose-1-phosphate aldolase
MTSISKTKEQMCMFGASLYDRGYTHGSTGNISVQVDGGWLVTPTNACLGRLDPAELSLVNKDGNLISGPKPTKEVSLHLAMYRSRQQTGAVVHLHSCHSVAVSMMEGIDEKSVLPPLTPYLVMKLGKVALLPYFRPGDASVSEAIEKLNGKYAACLLANHGPVIAGANLETAVYAAEELEENARLYLLLAERGYRALNDANLFELQKNFGSTW